MTKRKRIIQPVTFTEEEEYLLEYAKSQGKPFAIFIKDLIRKDKGEPIKQITKEDVIRIIEEYLKTHSVTTAINNIAVETPIENKKDGLGSKGKAAYKNLARR